DGVFESYPFDIDATARAWEIDMRPAIESLVREIKMKGSIDAIAAKFHITLVNVIIEVCSRIRESHGLNLICLSGGTFQNGYLLERVIPALGARGFAVYLNRSVPPNDGGISLGQAVIANAMIQQGG
ncbi:MAG TPA: carbamoyltransferase HypF, partial [Candidatus Binatia bacterium]|nr:carbamoyltransferase HypF [Candidatus Binatia bacterium]